MNNRFAKKDGPIIYDIFKNGQLVNEKKGLGMEGKPCVNICNKLNSFQKDKLLLVGIPCYSESLSKFLKTKISLLENVDFIKNFAEYKRNSDGQVVRNTMKSLKFVFVFIFDGLDAMDEDAKKWLLEIDPALRLPEGKGADPGWEAYCSMTEWAYRSQHINPTEPLIKYHMVTIIKKKNYRKLNSHHWFFVGICQPLVYDCVDDLESNVGGPTASQENDGHLLKNDPLIFLTDCGTRFDHACLCTLIVALLSSRDVIGATGRQRVDEPNTTFHACTREDNPFFCCCSRPTHERHSELLSDPCSLCWLCYLLSPAPLQGFEFEATMVLNSAPFNIVEAMPVLPGPCQLFKWDRIKKSKVVETYFKMIVSSEVVNAHYGQDEDFKFPDEYEVLPPTSILKEDKQRTLDNQALAVKLTREENVRSDLRKINMRLAEDRVFSFVVVFGSGMGTKWVPGATFMYEPELQFIALLEQRRRWINGTTACLFYFVFNKDAKLLVDGGTIHLNSKRLIKALWYVNVYQFFCVCIAPAVFAIALYTSISHDRVIFGQWLGLEASDDYVTTYNTTYYSNDTYVFNNITQYNVTEHFKTISNTSTATDYWIRSYPVDGLELNWAGILVVGYLTIYALWVWISFDMHPKDREAKKVFFNSLCMFLVLVGLAVILPVYLALITGILHQFTAIHIIVIVTMFGPVLIAGSQSLASAMLYVKYLAWFLIMLIFFLVFIPAYSLARLNDTSWGKGNSSTDDATNEDMEKRHKKMVGRANFLLVVMNLLLTWFFCWLHTTYRVVFMFALFIPTFAQIALSVVFLLIIAPARSFLYGDKSLRRENSVSNEPVNYHGTSVYERHSVAPHTVFLPNPALGLANSNRIRTHSAVSDLSNSGANEAALLDAVRLPPKHP